MSPSPGDIVYAFRRRLRTLFRVGIRHPHLVIGPQQVADDRGEPWVCALPLQTKDPMGTRLAYGDLTWIPLTSVGGHRAGLNPREFQVVVEILTGQLLAYTPSETTAPEEALAWRVPIPWLRTPYPTIREALPESGGPL